MPMRLTGCDAQNNLHTPLYALAETRSLYPRPLSDLEQHLGVAALGDGQNELVAVVALTHAVDQEGHKPKVF